MAAKENSAKFGYPISANRELVALGKCIGFLDEQLTGRSYGSFRQAHPILLLAFAREQAVYQRSDLLPGVGTYGQSCRAESRDSSTTIIPDSMPISVADPKCRPLSRPSLRL